MKRPRIAVVADLAEERWHSMDLVAEILMLGLQSPGARLVDAPQLRPSLVRPCRGGSRLTVSAPPDDFDLFHIVDHSYAHLVPALPPERSLVMCHDIDAFAGVL